MNLFIRQNIVGLLRHAAESVPTLRASAAELATDLQHHDRSDALEAASSLLGEAADITGDPVFLTGVYWAEAARADRGRAPSRPPSPHVTDGSAIPACLQEHDLGDDTWAEATRGMLELLDRRRSGATLEQALALFPCIGEEWAPSQPPHPGCAIKRTRKE